MPERLWTLRYRYVDDMAERRGPVRPAHLEQIETWKADGRLVMAGATGDPVSGGLLIFRVDDPAEVERFADEDPYTAAGLVLKRTVEPYLVV